MKILCLNNLEKTFYTTKIYEDMFYDTVEAFKIAGIEVYKYNLELKNTLIKEGYREVE